MKLLTSLQHPLVKRLVKLREDRKFRYTEKKVVIEGKKMVSEATGRIKKILVKEESFLPEIYTQKKHSVEIYLVSEAIIHKISGVESPEGIVAEIEMTEVLLPKECRRLLILDQINDPGNLGTLFRSALALGWEGIFLLPGCCDPYNDKALRAAKGATFHLPSQWGTLEECIKKIEKWKMVPLVAALQGKDIKEFSKEENIALVLGSEAKGASREILAFAKPVTIPMREDVESLNVATAGAILMYALKTC